MGEISLIYAFAALVGFALLSGRLTRSPISGPMFFTTLGFVGMAVAVSADEVMSATLEDNAKLFLELTLALVLFTDAKRLHLSSWYEDGDLPARLLGIGLPLTIIAGAVAAKAVFPDLNPWVVAIIGTVLAPTDAALGSAVVSNERVPARIRRALNIESGLNDGLALPILLFFIAGAEAEEGASLLGLLATSVGVALVVGTALSFVVATAIVAGSRRGWITPTWRQISLVATAGLVFLVADFLGGSGFVAVFFAGLVFGHITDPSLPAIGLFGEEVAQATTMLSFMIFGGIILYPVFGTLSARVWLYAVLSLTVVRALPVMLAMYRARLQAPTLAYLSWFGPRGLASIIFAGVVLEEVDMAGSDIVVDIMAATVALSILIHGVTAYYGANAYANWYERHGGDEAEMREADEVDSVRSRMRIRRG